LVRCSASSAARPAVGHGRKTRFACSYGAPPHKRQSGVASPHQLRHAHAVEMAREGVPMMVIQRQLGHANLGITSIYLQGIDNAEIMDTVHHRATPVIPASAGLHRPS
jgi:integrase